MLKTLETYFQNEIYRVHPHQVQQIKDKDPLRVLISGASCKSAESISYGLIEGSIFGKDQPLILTLFELPDEGFKLTTLLACQIATSGFGLVKDVIPTSDPKKAFTNIDIAILINPELVRNHGKMIGLFFHLYKNLGFALHRYAKKTVKVVTVGELSTVCAMICSKYAESIPPENISGLSRHIATRIYRTVRENLEPNYKNICGIHVWGLNRPDLKSATIQECKENSIPKAEFFTKNGDHSINMYTAVSPGSGDVKNITEGIQHMKWIKNAVKNTEFINVKCNDQWIGSAVCKHLKDWWNGTDNPVSMIVCSDGSYDIPKGLFFSFPVTIDCNKNWKIAQGIEIDAFTADCIKEDINYLQFMQEQILIYYIREEVKLLIDFKIRKLNEESIV